MRELTRRDALASATALGTVALAGCVAESDDDADDDGTDDSDPDDTTGTSGDGAATLELVDSDIETTATDCGYADTVSVSVTDGNLVLAGVCPSNTPCYQAVLGDVELDDDAISLVVDVERDPPEGECIECTGTVSYEATLSFSDSIDDPTVFDAVTVDHESGDQHIVVEDGSVVAESDDSEDGDSEPGDGDESDVTDPIVEYSITSEGHCGSDGVSEWTDDRTDETVTIDGVFSMNVPCYSAVVTDIGVENGTLSVDIGARSTADVCILCIGEVNYTAEITLAEGVSVDDVVVNHHGQGEDPESLGH